MTESPIVFCVANQKGGVGKTTTAVNLAASLALSERRTLLIDMDPQGNASSAFGISNPDAQVYDALVDRVPLAEIAQATELDFLRVVPSGKDLVGAEIELVDRPERERQLRDAITALDPGLQFILIDCPPSLGLLTLNALVAASRLLVPLQAEYYALEGLAHLLDTVERIRNAFNPQLELEGILLTMFDARNNLGHQVAAEVRTHFGNRVFDTVIPRNVRLSEAPSFGKPAILYDARSAGAQAYLRVAAEILERYDAAGAKSPTASQAASSKASSSATVASKNASSAASQTRLAPATSSPAAKSGPTHGRAAGDVVPPGPRTSGNPRSTP